MAPSSTASATARLLATGRGDVAGVSLSADIAEQSAAEAMQSFWRGLAPAPRLTVSEFADAERMLPEEAAMKGRWQTSTRPYLRAFMDAMSARRTHTRVVVKKASQLGFTEALHNAIGYHIAHDPCSMLFVMPTQQVAGDHVDTRMNAALASMPPVARALAMKRGRQKKMLKVGPGWSLRVAGGNSPSELASSVNKIVLVDEVDRMPPSAGDEGDGVDLAFMRMITFGDEALGVLVSTPTNRGESRIDEAYQDSDRSVWEVPCPHCDAFQSLRFDRLAWPPGRPDLVEYRCEACDEVIPESARIAMGQRGRYRATNPGHPTLGLWVNQLAEPSIPWSEIARDWERVQHLPERRKVFVNTRLGEVYDPLDIGGLDEGVLHSLREPYGPQSIPSGALVVTMAMDVQGDRVECEFVAWGRNRERWHVDLVKIHGRLIDPTVQLQLDALRRRQFTTADGWTLQVAIAGIDTGYQRSLDAYEFVRGRGGQKLFALKGEGGERDLWPSVAEVTEKSWDVPVYKLGVDRGKDIIREGLEDTARQRLGRDGSEPVRNAPGMVHWPMSPAYDHGYFEQLLAESPVPVYRHGHPHRAWKQRKGQPNEALDLAVYGLALFEGWQSFGYEVEATAQRVERAVTAEPPKGRVAPPLPPVQRPKRYPQWNKRR